VIPLQLNTVRRWQVDLYLTRNIADNRSAKMIVSTMMGAHSMQSVFRLGDGTLPHPAGVYFFHTEHAGFIQIARLTCPNCWNEVG
jgi:hypothetical protein